MSRYRIEQNLNREDSFDGAKPLQTEHADTRAEAVKIMKRLADGGQFYAAVFLGSDGECIEESEQ